MAVFGRKFSVVRVVGGHPAWPVSFPGPRDRFQGYTYAWPFKEDPVLGAWVIVPGNGGAWVAGIVGVDQVGKRQASELGAVIRIATDSDIEREIRRRTGSGV